MVALVLASASTVRRRLLAGAGLDFSTDAADVDEAGIKERLRNDGRSVEDTALALARAKAEIAARRHARACVIGADQVLEQDGRWLDKPADMAAARRHLEAFSGRRHRLVTAASAFIDGAEAWQSVTVSTLHVRPLSPAFIDEYLAAVGTAALSSVGAYQLESYGIQLFERIEGDYFSILGLPLVELLAFLRGRGLMAA